jgi:hypothetical protein
MGTLFDRLARLTTRHFRSTSRWQQSTFTAIFEENAWGDGESVSGPGSTPSRSADFQDDLIALLDSVGVGSIVDAPCGDFNWMRNLLERRPLSYVGIDIVAPLIATNSRRYAPSGCRFLCADMTRMELPDADLILCRDGGAPVVYRRASRCAKLQAPRFAILAVDHVRRPQTQRRRADRRLAAAQSGSATIQVSDSVSRPPF